MEAEEGDILHVPASFRLSKSTRGLVRGGDDPTPALRGAGKRRVHLCLAAKLILATARSSLVLCGL